MAVVVGLRFVMVNMVLGLIESVRMMMLEWCSGHEGNMGGSLAFWWFEVLVGGSLRELEMRVQSDY